MIAPRWRKVFRDLWINRTRTGLIVLAIAVGVFSIGVIGATEVVLQRELPRRYAEIDPAHIVFTTTLLDEELVDSLENVPGVARAEVRRTLPVRMRTEPAEAAWVDLNLIGIADYAAMDVYEVWPVSGQWPPEKGAVLIERGSMAYLGLQEGQEITLKTPQGRLRNVRITGVAHDLYDMPAFLEGTVYAFATGDTFEWLGQEPGYNEVYVRVEGDVSDPAYMKGLTDEITDTLEDSGQVVFTTFRPKAGSYPLDYIADTVLLLLTMLGVLILLLGCFLVINTISALIAQQVRQIGVIKAIGGRNDQITGIYLSMIFILGLSGTLLALPLSVLGADQLIAFLADQLNYTVRLEQFPVEIVLLQGAVGILVPILVALGPVLGGVRKPPAQALNEYARNRVWSGMLRVNRWLSRLRGISVPVLLSARNPFRRRSRLIFSLVMLTLAGGSFITVLNLNASLRQTVENMLGFWQYDFWVDLNRPYSEERLQQEAGRVPGVVQVEGWGFEMTRRIRPNGSESNPIFLFGVPPESRMTKPTILQGRWLEPGDTNALVVGMGLLEPEPDLRLGSEVVLKVNGEEETFQVVGVIEMIGNQTVGYVVYASQAYYAQIAHKSNRVDMAVVHTRLGSPEEKAAMGAAVEKRFEEAGIEVQSVVQISDERKELNGSFNIIIVLLMIMVVLLSFVGGLGLMGTMSLNVIERARELGVIRAYGGSNGSVFRIVVLEGVVVGAISWLFSLALALPLTWVFCDMIGRSFLSVGLAYRYSLGGAALWLGLVVGLSALSSVLPAWNAVRLTVREVLAFE